MACSRRRSRPASRGPERPREWLIDVMRTPAEKGSHPFQQPEAEAAYFINLAFMALFVFVLGK